jgi:hypothetical protein
MTALSHYLKVGRLLLCILVIAALLGAGAWAKLTIPQPERPTRRVRLGPYCAWSRTQFLFELRPIGNPFTDLYVYSQVYEPWCDYRDRIHELEAMNPPPVMSLR